MKLYTTGDLGYKMTSFTLGNDRESSELKQLLSLVKERNFQPITVQLIIMPSRSEGHGHSHR